MTAASLDNNLCERQLRDVALGRKNFLFAGSHDAARRTAVLYSLMRTCAQRGVPPLPYLTDVLRKLAAGSRRPLGRPDAYRPIAAACGIVSHALTGHRFVFREASSP